jgi:FkbM family methyltransferase
VEDGVDGEAHPTRIAKRGCCYGRDVTPERLLPQAAEPGELEGWSAELPPLLRLAGLWARRGPRATSWLPRKLGRIFGRNWRAVIETPDGLVLAVDPSNLDVFTEIMRRGGHEAHVVRACLDLMPDSGVFLDVGASAGYFSLSVAKSFPDGAVFAFEPQPSLARSLARSARLNGFRSIVPVAAMVGAFDGSGLLYVPAHSVHASAAPPGPGSKAIRAPVRTLDALVASGEVPIPDVIKIDVEGAERDVVRGARTVIGEHRPALVFEAVAEHTRRFGYEREELFALLSQYGDFGFAGIHPDGELAAWPDALRDPSIRDFVAVPRSRRGRTVAP